MGILTDKSGNQFTIDGSVDYTWPSFQNADIENADLTGANLEQGDFTNAILINVNFDNANLNLVKFVNMEGFAIFSNSQTLFTNLNFNNSFVLGFIAIGSNFNGSDFTDAEIVLSDFTSSTFLNGIFKRTYFEFVDFTNTNFSTANFSGIQNGQDNSGSNYQFPRFFYLENGMIIYRYSDPQYTKNKIYGVANYSCCPQQKYFRRTIQGPFIPLR